MNIKNMILFKNPQNIDVFKSFVDRFQKAINEKINGDTITICGINEQHSFFNYVASQNDPFATNIIIMNPFLIAINEKVCLQLNLTQEEQHAMLAHEIGHIFDESPRKTNNNNREYNADLFAINLNLANELKTGLEKIIASGNYSEQTQRIKERIKKMS